MWLMYHESRAYDNILVKRICFTIDSTESKTPINSDIIIYHYLDIKTLTRLN